MEKDWLESLKNGDKKRLPRAGKSISPTMNMLPLAGIFLKNFVLFQQWFPLEERRLKNPFTLARIRLVFPNWIPPNFHYQEEGYFWKIWFSLISIMVSYEQRQKLQNPLPSRWNSILLFTVFASGNHYRNVEAKKNFFAPIENCFPG